jgi:ubiquinone biosynthesis protein
MTTLLNRPWFADRAVFDRTRQIARVLAGHGLGVLLQQAGLKRFAPRVSGSVNGETLTQARRLRLAMGELGATFIKLAQMLSTRSDILPPDYLRELSLLQDSAPPVPIADILPTIERELHGPASTVFASFDLEPLASASIGQVHNALLPDGSRVVVKVQRPGVAEQIERDLSVLTRLVDWFENHTALGADYDLRALLAEFAHTIRGELDYVREGQNADRMRRAFEGDPGIHIPRVYWEFTTHRVLTLERMEGIKITDLERLDRAGISRRAVAETAVRTFLREILEFGYFHADPHPGNFFVEPDGTIALVDFGMVGRVSEPVQQHLLRAGLGALERDAEALAEELYALGVAGRRANRHAFEKDLDHLIARFDGCSIGELSATEVTTELSEIVFRHHLQLPSELALLLRVICMSEGMGLMLDPDFRYLQYASPILRRHWKERTSLRTRMNGLGKYVSESTDLALGLPRRTQRLLGRIERGEFELNVRHERLEEVTREFQHMTNRLSMALVLAASVVALSVAMGVREGSEVRQYVHWLFVFGFAFTLASGLWLVVTILRSGRR